MIGRTQFLKSKSIVCGAIRLIRFAATILALTSWAANAQDISDVPLQSAIATPPPIVMLVYDNSGSMDMEFMTEQAQGLFDGAYYLFPDEAYQPKPDHTYGKGHALTAKGRRKWQSQWAGCNYLYYSPTRSYAPWPSTAEHVFRDADLNHPVSDPLRNDVDGARCRMASTFFTINSGEDRINVINAHYFTHYDMNSDDQWDRSEPVYLVTWADGNHDGCLDLSGRIADDKRHYYRLADNGDGVLQDDELIPVHEEREKNLIRPARKDVSGRFKRFLTDKEELQNFVNWFAYYRRREFTAKEAAAVLIANSGKINAGLYAVNPGPRIGVRLIDKPTPDTGEAPVEGAPADLMDAIYGMDSKGHTPLRLALDQVGRYLRQDDPSSLGRSPFYSNADGGTCQRACTVIISDGLWNGDFSGVGNTDGDSGGPFADAWADTLADVAMAYYQNDLCPNLLDAVPSTRCDPSVHQHMNTYAVFVGSGPHPVVNDGMAAGQGLASCFSVASSAADGWNRPSAVMGVEGDRSNSSNLVFSSSSSGAGNVEDLRHATINGRGRYVSANSSSQLIRSLPQMLSDLDKPAYASELAVNAIRATDGSKVFQMTYRPEDWSGEVSAFTLNFASGAATSVKTSALWNASKMLPGDSNVLWDQRRIVTYGGHWMKPQGIAFRYDQMSAYQLAALGSDGVHNAIAEAETRELIDYIRGKPVSRYRVRGTLLGDITHSTPALFGRTLFVGANDGMLHAFDTTSGQERFAYIPGLVCDHLKMLADDRYVDQHRYYVDGPLYVGEVAMGEYRRNAYLVGGLGKGGKGYFCISVGRRERSIADGGNGSYQWMMHADHFGAGSLESQVADLVRWEYPRPDPSDDQADNDGDGFVDEPGELDPNLGYSFSQAYVVNANCAEGGYRPVVIFGNGYNSDSQKAMLYVLAADNGGIVRIIDTGAHDDNGLSTPALIDVDLDRRVDYAFAGDLNGNLWKFDLTAEDPARWGVAYGTDMNTDGVIDAAHGDLPAPLFKAPGQPITGRPDVMVMHSGCNSQAPGFMVFFGTGKYLGEGDRADSAQQSLYGIWDYGDDGDDSEYPGAIIDRPSGRLSSGLYLMRKQIIGEWVDGDQRQRQVSAEDIGYGLVEDLEDADGYSCNNSSNVKMKNPEHYAGWFLDFPPPADSAIVSSERVLGDVIVRGGNIIVPTYAPENRPCGGGGRSWLYFMTSCNGGTPMDVNGEPVPSKSYAGKISNRPVILKDVQKPTKDMILFSDHVGEIHALRIAGENWGKIYWRQSR